MKHTLTIIAMIILLLSGLLPLFGQSDSVDVTFYYYPTGNPNVVYLAGEFNNWANNKNGVISDPRFAMTYDANLGAWYKTERLRIGGPETNPMKPGAYEYKFNENGSSSGWLSDPRNPRQDPANYNNSIIFVKNPTIFYLLPNETSDDIRTRHPEVTAYIFPAVGDTVDTASIVLQVGPYTYQHIGDSYNPDTKQLVFRIPDALEDGEQTLFLQASTTGGSTAEETASFTVRADLVQLFTLPATTRAAQWRIQGGIFTEAGELNTSITTARLIFNNDTAQVSVSDGLVDTTIALEEGDNTIVLEAELNGTWEPSKPLVIERVVNHAPFAKIQWSYDGTTITVTGTASTDPDGQAITYQWFDDPRNPEPLTDVSGNTDGSVSFSVPATPGEYFVGLKVTDSDGLSDSTGSFFNLDSTGGLYFDDYPVNPSWVKNARIYCLFFKAFTPEGTIQAAIPNLDYIKSMGFNVIWVLPVMDTEGTIDNQINIGYNIVDFYQVAPEYGTAEDFKAFVQRAHYLGMKVILDVTPNHTGRYHPFAVEAKEYGSYSQYWNYYQTGYISHNDNGLGICKTKEGIYYYCAFSDALLNYNWLHVDPQSYMLDVYKYWIEEFGIDGFRFDVYWGPHRRYGSAYFDQPLRNAIRHAKPDVLLLGEDDGTGVGTEYIYADHNGGVDAAYDFKLYFNQVRDFGFSSSAVNGLHNELYNGGYFPGENSYYLRFMETQDEDRIAYKYNSFEKTMPMATAIFMAPGIPLLYNGQEVGFGKGMGAPGEPDLNTRRRGVIDWDFGGKSLLTPHYQKLAHIRAQFPAFHQHKRDTDHDGDVDSNDESDFIRVSTGNGIVYAFLRPYPDENGVAVMNFSGSEQTATLNISGAGLKFTDGFSTTQTYWVNDVYADTSVQVEGSALGAYTVTLPPYGTAIYVISTEEKHAQIPPISPIVSVKIPPQPVVTQFELTPNYPNPFNGWTTLRFAIPYRAEVNITVYNIVGEKIRTLTRRLYEAGRYSVQWDGTTDAGTPVPSGIYIVVMKTPEFVQTRKIILIK